MAQLIESGKDGAHIDKERLELLENKPIYFEPADDAELSYALRSPLWRISHLYKIMIKGDDEDEDAEVLIQTFVPNEAQLNFINNFHYRTIILKARQLGFTTFACIYFLDCALFRANVRAGMIAQTDAIAKKLFRDKVKFAYENLPSYLKNEMPLKRDSADECLFAHNDSSIWVSTSMRGGTLHYLHVSEFGKICAKYPDRADEVITGAFPAVPLNGIIIVESTAEGRIGHFYAMVQRAIKLRDMAIDLAMKQFKLMFYPWWKNKNYTIDPAGVSLTKEDKDYFDILESKIGRAIKPGQRAWYVMTRDEDFAGDEMMMFQEYPSTEDEPFLVSPHGVYFAKQIALARKQKRIRENLPFAPGVPCMTFWDIGNSDGTAIWVIQQIGQEFRVIRFGEWWGEAYKTMALWLQGLGCVFSTHYLPHDASHERQGKEDNKSPLEMLEELMPGQTFEIVPRIENINWGIQQTRDVFHELYFDETECKPGIIHLENYRKKWNEKQEVWSDKPDKSGGHSEAADALRQFAQAKNNGQIDVYRTKTKKRPKNWKTG